MHLFYNCQLAISPINWTNDDMHDLGNHYSFEDIVNDMSNLGFKGTELGRKYPRDIKTLQHELGNRGLILTSGWCDILFSDSDRMDESFLSFQADVLFLKRMGCRYVIASDGGGSVHWDPREDRSTKGVRKHGPKEWESLIKGLHMAGQYCKNHRMTFVYHIHTGTGIENMEEIDYLCANTDTDVVSLLIDSGHLYYCGVDPTEVVLKYRERIKYIHLKDVRKEILDKVKKEKINFNDSARLGVFTVPGDGDVDFNKFMHALAEIGYQGWMVIEAEQDPKIAEPNAYARKAIDYLQSITNLKP